MLYSKRQKITMDYLKDQIQVTCPKCQHKFSVDEALMPQIAKARSQIETELRQKMLDWQKDKEESLKKETEEKLRKELTSQNKEELKLLKEENEKQAKELAKTQELELQLRKEKNNLDEEKKAFDLKIQRQIDEERKKIQEKTESEVTEKFHLKEKEKDQLIETLKKSLDEAQRKASVGSQQLQGEVMELELEEILKREFPIDEMNEVKKGVRGADLIQFVKDQVGRDVGKIIWESKRTKAFTEEWILKLKEDMREAKADVSVIVSSVLPVGTKFFTQKDGVYITSFDCVLQVALILRKSLIDLASVKALSVGKNERKYEALYKYITSSEYAQYIGSMLDTFSKMKQTLDKEKGNMQRNWAEREKQIENLRNNTLTIHGSFSGLIEESLPEIKSLEFEEAETVVENAELRILS